MYREGMNIDDFAIVDSTGVRKNATEFSQKTRLRHYNPLGVQ